MVLVACNKRFLVAMETSTVDKLRSNRDSQYHGHTHRVLLINHLQLPMLFLVATGGHPVCVRYICMFVA